VRVLVTTAYGRAGIVHVPVGASEARDTEHEKKVTSQHPRIVSAHSMVGNLMDEKIMIKKAPKLITVSERNLQSAAIRLLPKHNKLVSPEVDYLRRVLGEKATQRDIDDRVLAVRKLPWSEIVAE